MKRLLLIVVLACVSWSSLPQTPSQTQEDTLKTSLLESEKNLQITKDTLLEYANFKKTIQLSKESNDFETLGKTYIDLAKWHEDHTVLDSSIVTLQKAIAVYKKQEMSKALADTYLLLVVNYSGSAEYDKGSETVYKALALYEKMGDQRGIAQCYTKISDLLYYSDSYAEGAEYCKKAIAIQEKNGYEEDLALSYRRLSENQLFLGNLDESLANMNRAIALYKKIGENGPPLLACYNGRGNIYKYMERFDEAIEDYNRCYNGAEKIGFTRYMMPPTANIGHVYILQGKYAEALPYNLRAIEIMKRIGNTKNLWENYMHVSNIYSELGDYKNALEYHELYQQGHAEYLSTIIARQESELQVKYETAKKDIEILDQQAKISQQRKTQWLYIGIAGLLGIILFGMYFTLKNIRKKRKSLSLLNIELDAKNKQNELLLKEIHHRVKNNLEMVKSLIALQSAKLEDGASKEAMLASQNRVQSMGIIHQKLYQGENLGSIEMKDYFINLGEGVLDTFNAEQKVKIECAMDNLDLDVDTAVPIGLIVNELLTNALKYAFPEGEKGQINISLKKENDGLFLKVSDNGIGKTVGLKPKGTGFGTQLIQLLTQQLNGTISEEYTNGTTVFFNFKNFKTA
ncbi:tetratricopeptide repeat-containing sensor histidine kinase [Aequorivita lipolytica]|uniref:histidine kinase n=1 Tax=Aequorivita lipolytica TaxID=153267 RepID=A0A5C6YR10_9FLAO|nr:tetratricopeptide repeat protein [Aequorivita lipolytica]TXD69830.1 tetratricopeptide repeat protein [Aequorivita lipolytica]SRX50358.1 putative sensor histidine kinase pdtaS [Aequorivita lipolytica]